MNENVKLISVKFKSKEKWWCKRVSNYCASVRPSCSRQR